MVMSFLKTYGPSADVADVGETASAQVRMPVNASERGRVMSFLLVFVVCKRCASRKTYFFEEPSGANECSDFFPAFETMTS